MLSTSSVLPSESVPAVISAIFNTLVLLAVLLTVKFIGTVIQPETGIPPAGIIPPPAVNVLMAFVPDKDQEPSLSVNPEGI